MQRKKKMPKFKTIEEESNYWDNQSTTVFESEEITEEFFKSLKKSSEPKKKVTLRLDIDLIEKLKKAAKKFGVPYQKFTRELIKTGVSKVL